MIKSYDDIGEVEIRSNIRAKSIVVRYRDGKFRLTHPSGMREKDIDIAIYRLKDRLLVIKQKSPQKINFSPDNIFQTYSFDVKIVERRNTQYSLILKENTLYIVCPTDTNYNDLELQTRIRNSIIQVMRKEAKRLFPNWIKALAVKHGFEVSSIKINNSQSRWGSCSAKKNINLSLYCMLLPQHLIEFIMLHELCHTMEMNHSKHFWALLDKVTNNRSKELTAELKKHKTNF